MPTRCLVRVSIVWLSSLKGVVMSDHEFEGQLDIRRSKSAANSNLVASQEGFGIDDTVLQNQPIAHQPEITLGPGDAIFGPDNDGPIATGPLPATAQVAHVTPPAPHTDIAFGDNDEGAFTIDLT